MPAASRCHRILPLRKIAEARIAIRNVGMFDVVSLIGIRPQFTEEDQMNTPWGDIEVADAHVHFFSPTFFKTLAQQKGQADQVSELIAQLGWEAPPINNAALGARWAEELDRQGVARSVLMSSIPDDEASAAEAVRAFPDRFLGYFMFNPKTPDAAGRAARAFDDLGMQGLCLFPAMHRYSIQDDALEPVLALAEKRKNVVVFVHTGVLTVGVRK